MKYKGLKLEGRDINEYIDSFRGPGKRMGKLERIRDIAKELNLNYLKMNASKIIGEAGMSDSTYQDMLLSILEN